MIQECAHKLLENLPKKITNISNNKINKITQINLILEGGAFNFYIIIQKVKYINQIFL